MVQGVIHIQDSSVAGIHSALHTTIFIVLNTPTSYLYYLPVHCYNTFPPGDHNLQGEGQKRQICLHIYKIFNQIPTQRLPNAIKVETNAKYSVL